jgi:outer membrane protein assembly factor BamB
MGSVDKNLYAFDAITGTELWSVPVGAPIRSSPAVANGVVYVGSLDNNLYAFDAATGTKLWSAPAGSWINTSSPAVANGVVYVGSYGGNMLYASGLPTP